MAKDFAANTVAPNAPAWESDRTAPRDTLKQAADAGLCRLLASTDAGGEALPVGVMARIMEELSYADMAFAFALVVHNNLTGAICRRGRPDQVERYAPDMMTGRRIGAFLLTEAKGGSDAAAIATTATPDGDGWRLNGEKAWITNAAHADVLSVYAQTDAAQGWRGIAAFLIDANQDGVIREAPYEMLGCHATGAGGFRFEDCKVTADQMFVPPGEGFKAAMSGIDVARVNVAAMCSGMLRCGLETALEFTARHQAFGAPIADLQGLQWMLADVATDLEASRALAYVAAQAIDSAGDNAAIKAAHAKKFATRAALARLADCMQVMGARGFRQDLPLARHLAAAKMAQYLDGTTEIQNVVIARALLKPYR